jgi:hypothetical protein
MKIMETMAGEYTGPDIPNEFIEVDDKYRIFQN